MAEDLGKPRQLNSLKIEEILLRNPLNSNLERETGLEPATTCLEGSVTSVPNHGLLSKKTCAIRSSLKPTHLTNLLTLHNRLLCYPGPQPIVLQSHLLLGYSSIVVRLASSVLVGRRNLHRLEDSALRPSIMVFGQPALSPSYQIRQGNLFI